MVIKNGKFLFRGGKRELEKARQHKEDITCLEIGEGVECIPEEAFYGFESLEKLVPHNKLREIGKSAFQSCDKLADLGDLSSVEVVEGHAFAYCGSVNEQIKLPNATEIGAHAFVCCNKITSVFAPKATTIGKWAFGGCTNIAPANVTCPYDSIYETVFETKEIFSAVEALLRVEEAGRYKKIFKMYLTNLDEFVLTVESYNKFNEPQPQAELFRDLSDGIQNISKQYQRNGQKGATFQKSVTETIDEPILQRAIYEGWGGVDLEGGGQSNTSVWIIPIEAYEAIESWLEGIGRLNRKISKHNRDSALTERKRKAQYKFTGPLPDAASLEKVPTRLRNQLTSFQREGVDFIIGRKGRCFLADEMGVGKTIQAIASMSAFSKNWPLLVICPGGLINNWKNEFLKWLGRKNGSKKDEGRLILNANNIKMLTKGSDRVDPSENEGIKVFIVSFHLASKFQKNRMLYRGMFNAIIIDESHELGNEKTQKTEACSEIANAAKRLVIISGSPALSTPSELNPQISLLEANGNDTEESALTKFTGKKSKVNDLNSLLENVEFGIVLKILMIRRLKDDVLKFLPQKERLIVPVDIEGDEVIEQTKNFLETSRGDLARLVRGQNIAKRNEGDGEERVRRGNMFRLIEKTGLAKVRHVGDKLKRFIAYEKGKVCVFAMHTLVLDRLEKIVGKEISIRIDGNVKPKKRQERIDLFRTDKQKRVALLSLNTAGVGFSLTESSTIFMTELCWTPNGLIQAEDRCHRIGQRSKVTCHYFIAKGSLDEAMLELVRGKYEALRQFVPTKEETLVYSTPELPSEQPRPSIHQNEAREIDAPIAEAEAESKVFCQAVTDSSDQLGGKRPAAAQSRRNEKSKRTCFSRNCNKRARKGSFCDKHVCKKKKYTCSYGDCTFLVANVNAKMCQNHVGVMGLQEL